MNYDPETARADLGMAATLAHGAQSCILSRCHKLNINIK